MRHKKRDLTYVMRRTIELTGLETTYRRAVFNCGYYLFFRHMSLGKNAFF